jgi:PAS domain S-box-containing protein
MNSSRLRLLEAIQEVQARFIDDAPRSEVFASILAHALEMTGSGYGFVGELLHTDDVKPHIRAIAVTDRLWNPDALYGEILRTGEHVIHNEVAADVQSRLPAAPYIRSFLGIPLYHLNELVGVLALANGAKGYEVSLIDELEPFSQACARILIASRISDDRHDAESALRESETRFRQLAENIHEVFWLTDLEPWRVIYVSPAYAKIWGRSTEDLYQDPRNWIDGIHPDDREEVTAAFINANRLGMFDEEYRVVQPNGSIRWVHDRGFPFQSDQGEVIRVAGIAEDITDRKRLETTVRRSEQRLRHSQRIEALGRVTGGVAHDFNNLLTVINGNVNMLLGKSGVESDRRLLKQVAQAGGRAAGLTRQLLAFSRKQVLELRVIDIRELFENLSELLPPIVGSGVVLELVADTEPHFVKADMHQLVQVVMNLAVNARDAMPQGGRLRITSRAEFGESEFVEMVIADKGVGIPKGVLPYIFDPFFTTKEEGKGSGLGLSTVFGIVTQLGGKVEAETREREGSTFRIRLPSVKPGDACEDASVEAPLSPQRPLCILLVDDEPLVRAFAALTLLDRGHTVIEADSGGAALDLVEGRESDLDILVTDVVMPGLSGTATARQLRSRNPRLSVLYISGNTAEHVDELGASKNGMSFLSKPFVADDLIREVEAIARDDGHESS